MSIGSLKEEILLWSAAISHYDRDELKDSLFMFKKLKKTSKIYYNIGIIYRVRGQNQDAIKAFSKATLLDPWFAIAYFMKGVCYCENDRFNEAVGEFNECLERLRGNHMIDYTQLGLNLVLESADILLNRGICYYMVKRNNYAQDDLKAAQEVSPENHPSLTLKLADLATVPFMLAEIVEVFCPPSNKITKDEKVDYLGKSKIIAAVEDGDIFTGFLGRIERSSSSPHILSHKSDNQAHTISLDRAGARVPHHIITNSASTSKALPSPPTPLTASTPVSASKGRIKVKFIYNGKAKILMAPDDVTFDELLRKLRKKCNAEVDLFGEKPNMDRISNDKELDKAIDAGEPVIIYCE
eukprot:NODE_216_length_14242_cov_0.417592.p2 type:complete len:354 gc:universal NODE_216_length_14242_cov_0.417592:7332-6271(-)